MDDTSLATHHGDYGDDAPYALPGFTAVAALALVTAVVSARPHLSGTTRPAAISVATRRLGWRFWYGNPVAGTSLVTARKPAA